MIPRIGNSSLAMVGNKHLKDALCKGIRRSEINKNLSKINKQQMNWHIFKD